MVLLVNGSLKYFDDHLLTLMRQHKNTEVRTIFDDYHADASRPLVSLLIDSRHEATLLHYAAEYGNDSIAQYLIDLKSKTDHRNAHGRTPLMSAVLASGSEAVVRVLLRAGSDLHSIDNFGKSILQMILGESNRANLINVLLEEVPLSKIVMINHAQRMDDENSRKTVSKEQMGPMKKLLRQFYAFDSIRKGTLLHRAVELQLFKAAKVLLDYGADANVLDSWKAIPLYYLYIKENVRQMIDIHTPHTRNNSTRALEMLKILVSRSTRLTSSAEDGSMQIYKLLKYENGDAIEILVRSPNIDLNASDERGNTALHYLAVNKNPNVFARLHGLKFDVNVRNKNGYTPLHKAVLVKSLESVKFLLENGADVNGCANQGKRTPLYSAYDSYRNHSKSIVELLFSYGADPQAYVIISGHLEWTIFDSPLLRYDGGEFADLTAANPAIERLAIVEALGTEITSRTRLRIGRHSIWMNHLDSCRRMIKTVVYGDVTVLVILTVSEKRLMAYARNKELVFRLKKIIDENLMYKYLLRTRLKNAINLVELEDEAIEAFGKIFCSGSNVFYTVAHFVMAHLNKEDMKNLCSAFSE